MKPFTLSFCLILVVLSLSLSSDSQAEATNELRGSTSSGKEGAAPAQKQRTAGKNRSLKDHRGTEDMPLIIKGLPAERTAEQVAEERKEREGKSALDRELTTYTGYQALFTFALLVVGVFQLGFFWWQLGMIRESLSDTKIAAEAAKSNAIAALEQAKAITLSERAYVKFSHVPPGLQFEAMGGVWVQMQIKNFGRTPARIQRVAFTFLYLPKGEVPPIEPPRIPLERVDTCLAFLVPNDEIFSAKQASLGMDVASKVRNGEGTILVWGHVDYLDQFDQRHRAGYGRVYEAEIDRQADDAGEATDNKRSNLMLVVEKSYNYDRPRQPDER